MKNVSPTVLLYMTESLNSFRGASYLGSAVMFGVAAETALLALRDAVHSALDTQQKKDKFKADTNGRPAKRIYVEIRKRLDSLLRQISSDLGMEDISAELTGIFDLIRKTRNEAGHPTGRKLSGKKLSLSCSFFRCIVTLPMQLWIGSPAIQFERIRTLTSTPCRSSSADGRALVFTEKPRNKLYPWGCLDIKTESQIFSLRTIPVLFSPSRGDVRLIAQSAARAGQRSPASQEPEDWSR
ncbi:hypothetical protein [Edaphobacter acidisoli]|uniref:hypothetical protein n=1 Tax=Edaphobacter acidisoli TaxID=2040573 RepID=UPI00166B03AC|nr:hypothetical protein [Edaphobacter acidisoli]